MKKILCAACIVCLMVVGVAEAGGKKVSGGPRQNCGCGLGSMWLKNYPGLLAQCVAAILNGCMGNQTFGITSGTLDCKKAPYFASNEELNRFVAENLDNLAKDIAVGHGESLDTLADLMEVPPEERAEFSSTLQEHFSHIFPSEDVDNVEVIEHIVHVLERG